MSIYLEIWSILQNTDISLYKVDWLLRIYICQNTLVCSHIPEAQDKLLMLLGASQRGFHLLLILPAPSIHQAKAPFEPTARLCTRYYSRRLISKRVVARTPITHTNNFIGSARLWNINRIIRLRCKNIRFLRGGRLDFHIRFFLVEKKMDYYIYLSGWYILRRFLLL